MGFYTECFLQSVGDDLSSLLSIIPHFISSMYLMISALMELQVAIHFSQPCCLQPDSHCLVPCIIAYLLESVRGSPVPQVECFGHRASEGLKT